MPRSLNRGVVLGCKQLTDKTNFMSEALKGQATPEQIAAWKEQFKNIYSIEVEGYVGYFQNPNRKHMNAAMSKANPDAALDMYEFLAKLTKIGGAEELISDDELFFGLTQHLKTKMDGKKGQLVNL